MNYAKAVDLTQTFQESYERLYESINAIDQGSEYTSFIEENKEWVVMWYSGYSPLFVVACGASRVWSLKKWACELCSKSLYMVVSLFCWLLVEILQNKD